MNEQTKPSEPGVARVATALDPSESTTTQPIGKLRAAAAAKIPLGCPLNVNEVAAFCGFHRESVRRAIRRGRLHATTAHRRRGWLITRASLAAYLNVPENQLVPSEAANS